MKYERFIASRYLLSRRRGSFVSVNGLFSILGVTLGVAALIIALSVMNGFEAEVRTSILGVTSHITVFPRFNDFITDPDSAMAELKQIDGVTAAAPFIYYKAAISSSEAGDGIVVRGVDLKLENEVTDLEDKMFSGFYDLSPNDEGDGGIILGRSLAARLDVKPGDIVVLYSISGDDLRQRRQPRVKRFEVRGMFEVGMYQYDDAMAYISIEDAADLFKTHGVTGIHLRTNDIHRADAIAAEINRRMAEKYDAVDWKLMNKSFFSWMQLEKMMMFIALSLIIAVAAFNIISTLVMIVMEKRHEIGILKTMGSLPGSIARIFIRIGVTVGVIGCLVGWALGYLLCWIQVTFNIISLPPDIYFFDKLPIEIRLFDFLAIGLAAIVLCFLATIYPARKAVRLAVVEVLRQ